MEKKLLLLGILRKQDMHGYLLNHMLDQDVTMPITLKKSNAYKILKTMEADGWITQREERHGNRPYRQVYSITKEGRNAFDDLVRKNLADYPGPEFPSLVAYKYLEGLSARESLELLENRREKIASRLEEINSAISPNQDMQTAKLDKLRDLDLDDVDDKSKLDANNLGGKQDSTQNLSMDILDFLSNYYTGEIDWIDELIYGLRGKLP
ncbi:MAG: PadR family transcriptional regulator [Anaerolineales bacterium]